MNLARVILKRTRSQLPPGHHPWIFSGAVDRVEGTPEAGGIVHVEDSQKAFVAWGYFNQASRIPVRLLEWEETVHVNEAWWRKKLRESVERRRGLSVLKNTDAVRLVHAEADGLPGLIADQYRDVVVIQCLTAGVERMKVHLIDELQSLLHPSSIFERSDTDTRWLEKLEPKVGCLSGAEPPETLEIEENGHRFQVDVRLGQKTGFFLDQRENRQSAGRYAAGREILDCFAYTGGFAVSCLLGQAQSVCLLDSSLPALQGAQRNLRLNGLPDQELVEGDAFKVLRGFRDQGRSFDMIVLDPPKLAPTRAHAEKAARAYKDLNLLSMKLLKPCGILHTFSCSAGIDREQFSEILHWASLDSGRTVHVIETLGQAQDHPIRLGFPESEYLKGCVCQVL